MGVLPPVELRCRNNPLTSRPTIDPDRVRAHFHNFGKYQAPENGSPLYQELSFGVLADPEMLGLAARCSPSQMPPNLLFAAVHYLLLRGAQHPLRDFYPDVVVNEKEPRQPSKDTYALFREFVWEHASTVIELLETRLVQTNVVRRTTCLLLDVSGTSFAEMMLNRKWARWPSSKGYFIVTRCSGSLGHKGF